MSSQFFIQEFNALFKFHVSFFYNNSIHLGLFLLLHCFFLFIQEAAWKIKYAE